MDHLLRLQRATSRRGFLKTTGIATLNVSSPPTLAETTAEAAPLPTENVRLTINGRRYALDIDPRTTLLDALREHLGLTGSKKGCDHGQCGACTVQLGQRSVLSCLVLAASVREPVTTIALARPPILNRVAA